MRALLMRVRVDEFVVLLNMHHIVSDEWSLGILIRELTALYAGSSSGRPSDLPDLPIQYADFASWQRRWLQGEVLEKQLGYWRDRLAGLPPLLELPTDRPRFAGPILPGRILVLRLSRELVPLHPGAEP